MIRRPVALVLLMLFLAPRVEAAGHFVSQAQVQAALADAAGRRATDVARLEGLLSSPAAARAASHVGADLARVRRALPQLKDAELHDLAARAGALETDPAAGDDSMVSGFAQAWQVWVLLVVLALLAVTAIVLLVKAVD